MNNKHILSMAFAGKFYPASRDVLEKDIAHLLSENNYRSNEKIFAIMSPHAGYMYAGPVYGAAYSAVNRKKIKTVIIISNSHHSYFDGISVYAKGGYETPLGKIYVDADLAEKIIKKDKKISFNEKVYNNEHSIEAQLPFIKTVLPNGKIVPIIMGNDLMATCDLLALSIQDAIIGRDDILIVASSDMSHYPSYDAANKVDKEVLDMIKKGSAIELEKLLFEIEIRGISGGISFLCGAGAVKTTMILAKAVGANKIDVLKYLNSGDVSDKGGVVGYGAVAFSK
ncbi:MAG: AmmeMemoRadiSam system protein B [bacterium]